MLMKVGEAVLARASVLFAVMLQFGVEYNVNGATRSLPMLGNLVNRRAGTHCQDGKRRHLPASYAHAHAIDRP